MGTGFLVVVQAVSIAPHVVADLPVPCMQADHPLAMSCLAFHCNPLDRHCSILYVLSFKLSHRILFVVIVGKFELASKLE